MEILYPYSWWKKINLAASEIMVFAIADEVKKQLIEVPFLGLCHGIECEPNQRWYIAQKLLWRDKAQRVPPWIAELLYANRINVVSQ
jgi:hypothetical protein